MSIKRPERLSLVQQVTVEIERLIKEGHWTVGERIPSETTLATKFGVSRNTIREAVRALIHTGVLEAIQGSGTVIKTTSIFQAMMQKEIDRNAFTDTVNVRFALEMEAARLASLYRTNEQLEQLQHQLNICHAASQSNNYTSFLEADFTFHQLVVESSNNELLIALYEQLARRIKQSIVHFFLEDQPFPYKKHTHEELVKAIRLQQPEHAVQDIINYRSMNFSFYQMTKD